MSWTYWGIVIGLASLQDSRIVNHQQASCMTVWRWLDPCGRSLCGILWLSRSDSEEWVCP
jgi:hypothetical protein